MVTGHTIARSLVISPGGYLDPEHLVSGAAHTRGKAILAAPALRVYKSLYRALRGKNFKPLRKLWIQPKGFCRNEK